MKALIRLERVGKDYSEGGSVRTVLRETNAELEQGQWVAIRGRSGSGKTTLLNLLAGLDLPTRGDVFVGDVHLSALGSSARTLFRRDHVGFVFQFFNLIPTLSVLENAQLPAELAGLPRPEAARRARALLAEVGLAGREAAFPDRLSGGEQQRVAIARALVTSPPLVLADEPTGNLDDDSGQAVLDLLERLTRAAGKTLVLVTHSAQVAARADREFTIDHGQLVELHAEARSERR